MGNRLSKIYTRTGDDGTTGLSSGERLAKDQPRVAAMGDIDELNSTIGLLLTGTLPVDIRDALSAIQHDLFDLGADLANLVNEAALIAARAQLEAWISRLPTGCSGRAFIGYSREKIAICSRDTCTGCCITIHSTPSLHGGVVSEPM